METERVVFRGTKNHGYNVVVPGYGKFEKGRPQDMDTKKAAILVKVDGFDFWDEENDIMPPPVGFKVPADATAYYCTLCGSNHKIDSQIGIDHRQYAGPVPESE